jgi:hypothetical protein
LRHHRRGARRQARNDHPAEAEDARVAGRQLRRIDSIWAVLEMGTEAVVEDEDGAYGNLAGIPPRGQSTAEELLRAV